MPPSQWVKERQNRIERGMLSISVRTDAPVVLKPDQASKKESIKLSKLPETQKGKAPTTEAINHPRDTIRNPSRDLSL